VGLPPALPLRRPAVGDGAFRAALAARAGLSTAPYRQSSDAAPARPAVPPASRRPSATVFVVGGRVVAAPPVRPPLRDACRRLADLAGDDLLGIEVAPPDDGRREFVAATPVPDLRAGGEPLLDALALALGGES
jgi:hypothetical protein